MTPSTSPTKAWTRLLGTSESDSAFALTTGSDGAIYVAGYTEGSLDGQTNSGGIDAFLTKYDANGNKAWTRLLGTSSTEQAQALTTGTDGAIFMAGFAEGSLDGQTSSGDYDAFLTKWSVSAALPALQFATSSGSANEGSTGSTTVTVQATLSAASTQAVTVPVTYSGTATLGIDYTSPSTSITIAAGQTTGSATFSVVGDTTLESNETVILTMGTPSNAVLGTNTVYTHTITNDDTLTPTYSVSANESFVNEGSSATFKVSTTNVASGTALSYALTGVSASDIVGG